MVQFPVFVESSAECNHMCSPLCYIIEAISPGGAAADADAAATAAAAASAADVAAAAADAGCFMLLQAYTLPQSLRSGCSLELRSRGQQ